MALGKPVVYGPYERRDGRQHVILVWPKNKKRKIKISRTVSYPKFLLEQYLGRSLDPDEETVDHIDGNFRNNDIKNLRTVKRSIHASEEVPRFKRQTVPCVWCAKLVEVRTSSSNKSIKAGPFCSRRCSGQYGAALQHRRCKKLGRIQVEVTTYKLKYCRMAP